MKNLKKFILNIEMYISIFLLVVMLIGLTYQTVARYVFHQGTSWMEEMCGYGLLCLVFISASYACQNDAHMRIDSVTALYPNALKKYIEILGNLVWLGYSVFITYLGARHAVGAWANGYRALSVELPLGLVYCALPIGYGCMSIRLLVKIMKTIKNEKTKEGSVK